MAKEKDLDRLKRTQNTIKVLLVTEEYHITGDLRLPIHSVVENPTNENLLFYALSQTVENLEREINNYYNLPEIGQLAQKKGMIVPEADQIRNIHVPGLESEHTSAQAGEAGEKVPD